MRICWKCVNPCPPSSLAVGEAIEAYSMTALRIFANDFFGMPSFSSHSIS